MEEEEIGWWVGIGWRLPPSESTVPLAPLPPGLLALVIRNMSVWTGRALTGWSGCLTGILVCGWHVLCHGGLLRGCLESSAHSWDGHAAPTRKWTRERSQPGSGVAGTTCTGGEGSCHSLQPSQRPERSVSGPRSSAAGS